MSTDTFTNSFDTTYTFRRITKTQAEILMMVGEEDTWTTDISGPVGAVRERFDRLHAASQATQKA